MKKHNFDALLEEDEKRLILIGSAVTLHVLSSYNTPVSVNLRQNILLGVIMMELDQILAIPLVLNLLFSILSGMYNRFRFDKSGMVIASYKHSVLDREEIITYIVILVVSSGFAYKYKPDYLLVILMMVVLGSISKYKMAQDITFTETGLLIKGKYEKWKNVTRIAVTEDNKVDVDLGKKGYEIEGMVEVEEFIRLTQSYFGQSEEAAARRN